MSKPVPKPVTSPRAARAARPGHGSGEQAPPPRRPLRVEILACDDAMHGPAMAAIDVMAIANILASMRGRRSAAVHWQWRRPDGKAAPRNLPASGARGRAADLLIVPGWQARNGPHLDALVRRDRAAIARVREVHESGGHVLGIYTGVAMLGAAGLLDGRDAVVPWPFVQSVKRQAPLLRLEAGEGWICRDRIWTCDSPALVTEAMVSVLRELGLQALSDSVGHVLLHSRERQRLSGQVAATSTTRIGAGTLERARRWLEDHLDRPYSLEETARAAATSSRSLLRHFRAALGTTPLQYLHEVRAMRARMLLETSYLPVDGIAELCGYRDTAMFRRVFEKSTGMTPSAYREKFRLRDRRREWGRDLRA
ncbi:helix-turn-helix domain-containing protein [Burkholderiaceae bacterium FT117]|uniref:GlxA family transcriptional regulator n=1 Tax=Zeimonas sediminis TaxID=2944268 RepID=UPI0023431EC6|nr:helix-turn-helix domain-containing protein [Zeimonas sediminis]MCM5572142.1 helix-turn-helix domain-containing protein [Zeimonas sediminis]